MFLHVAYRPFQVPIRLHDKIKETRDPVVGLDFVKVNKLKFDFFVFLRKNRNVICASKLSHVVVSRSTLPYPTQKWSLTMSVISVETK